MISLMLAIALAQNPVVTTGEPAPASHWYLSTRASCGRRQIIISGYGASVHSGATPKVTYMGRPLRGSKVAQLIADLSTISAIYHFSVQCERTGEVYLKIYEGEAQQDDTVRYRYGRATIKAGKLDYYSGLEPSDAGSFWFR